MRLIGIAGLAGSGKSLAASILQEEIDQVRRISFAEPLKRMIGVLVPPERGKTDACPELCGKTLREGYQTLGTEWGRQIIGQDVWVNAALRKAASIWRVSEKRCVVIDDVRFDNEAEAIVKNGGIVLEIKRSGVEQMTHASEQGIRGDIPRIVILNDGSINELKSAVLAAATEFLGIEVTENKPYSHAARRALKDAFLSNLPADLLKELENVVGPIYRWRHTAAARSIVTLAKDGELYSSATAPVDILSGLRNAALRRKHKRKTTP